MKEEFITRSALFGFSSLFKERRRFSAIIKLIFRKKSKKSAKNGTHFHRFSWLGKRGAKKENSFHHLFLRRPFIITRTNRQPTEQVSVSVRIAIKKPPLFSGWIRSKMRSQIFKPFFLFFCIPGAAKCLSGKRVESFVYTLHTFCYFFQP